MNKLLMLSTALVLTAVSVSQAAIAQGHGQDKPGKGADRGQGHKDHPGKGGGADNKHSGKGGGGDDAKAKGQGKGPKDDDRRPEQRAGRDDKHGRDKAVVVEADRGRDHADNRQDRRVAERRDGDRPVVVTTRYRERGLIRGCPPGLAKKDNGCLPPGQAKAVERVRYDFSWDQPGGGYVYRYDDGYQYRYDRQGSLLGYLPALGGVLASGNPWPAQYQYDPALRYQLDYYGLDDPYDYRYADGALYSVDPQTSMIQQVVALLTGQTAQVGQQMPSGYDIYNVPYPYRNQYVDNASSAYRYNDGAIYQIDPKTQIVMSVIQLLTQGG